MIRSVISLGAFARDSLNHTPRNSSSQDTASRMNFQFCTCSPDLNYRYQNIKNSSYRSRHPNFHRHCPLIEKPSTPECKPREVNCLEATSIRALSRLDTKTYSFDHDVLQSASKAQNLRLHHIRENHQLLGCARVPRSFMLEVLSQLVPRDIPVDLRVS